MSEPLSIDDTLLENPTTATTTAIADPVRYKKMLERDAELLLRMSGQKALPAHIVDVFGRELLQADRALRTCLRNFAGEPTLGWVYAAVSASNVFSLFYFIFLACNTGDSR